MKNFLIFASESKKVHVICVVDAVRLLKNEIRFQHLTSWAALRFYLYTYICGAIDFAIVRFNVKYIVRSEEQKIWHIDFNLDALLRQFSAMRPK